MKATAADRIARIRDKHKLATAAGVGLMAFSVKSADVRTDIRELVCTATTDSIDLDREVVVPSGADTTYYATNRANFVDHDYRAEMHVATMRNIRAWPDERKFNGWLNRSRFFSGLKSPLADDILTIAAQAGVACSIGFETIQGGPPIDTDPPSYQEAEWVHRKWRWLELSFTFMPCNMGCRQVGGPKALPEIESEKMAVVDALICKGRKRGGVALASAVALGFPYQRVVAVSSPKRVELAVEPRRVVLEGA